MKSFKLFSVFVCDVIRMLNRKLCYLQSCLFMRRDKYSNIIQFICDLLLQFQSVAFLIQFCRVFRSLQFTGITDKDEKMLLCKKQKLMNCHENIVSQLQKNDKQSQLCCKNAIHLHSGVSGRVAYTVFVR